jgi:IS30 family transposase
MADLKEKKNKHLTLDERLEIQECLDHGMTFKAVAARIGKDQTTISKEVKKRLAINPTTVRRTGKDGESIAPKQCQALLKAPFVCNPCRRRHTQCGFEKRLYRAKNAHDGYKALLAESREGVPLNKEEFYETDRIVSDGIKRGQHLYHIMKSNDIGVSKSTIYRHLKRGYLSACAIDFPRVVKFKARRQKYRDYVPKAAKAGRTHEDFLAHISEAGITAWVEMDTVIGRVGGKTIMTFDFTLCNFMFGLLLGDKTSLEAANKIIALKATFAAQGLRFGDVFPVLLTDNGGEFANVAAIENNLDGEKELSLFFCDPYRSCQKPKVEKNHTLFRPAGKCGAVAEIARPVRRARPESRKKPREVSQTKFPSGGT